MDDAVKKLVRTLGQTWVDFPCKTTLLPQSITSPGRKHRVYPSLPGRASWAHRAAAFQPHSRRTIELAAAISPRSRRWLSARHAHIKASIIHADIFPSLQSEGNPLIDYSCLAPRVQPWGVLLISMANNMTYESAGDIQPPRAPPPLHHGSEMGNRSLHQGQICLPWFGYSGGAGWGVGGGWVVLCRRLYSFTSQRRVRSEINYTDRYVESFFTLWFPAKSVLSCGMVMGHAINDSIDWVVKK